MIKFNNTILFMLFLIILCISCFSPANNKDSKEIKTSSSEGKDTVLSIKINQGLLSGIYNETSVAYDGSNLVTGVYEYYDQWDETAKEYTQINHFFFVGHFSGSNQIQIKAGWPSSDQQIDGTLTLTNNTVSLKLNSQPYGYSDVDFTKGYTRNLTTKKNWKQIRLVKSTRAKLYNDANSSSLRKGYLVKNDVIKVIDKKDSWLYIEFNPINDNEKSSFFWINEIDLYPLKASELRF